MTPTLLFLVLLVAAIIWYLVKHERTTGWDSVMVLWVSADRCFVQPYTRDHVALPKLYVNLKCETVCEHPSRKPVPYRVVQQALFWAEHSRHPDYSRGGASCRIM